jgi:hypothetical protein
MKRGRLFTVFGLLILGAVIVGMMNHKDKQLIVSEAPESPITITAEKLIADYEANEVAADGVYKNKLVIVSGTINTIGKDILNTPYVSLKTPGFTSVQCMFKDEDVTELSALTKGQRVSIEGRVSGKLMSVLLRGCKLNP